MAQNKSSLDENNKLNVFIGNCRVCMSKSDPVKSLFHPDRNFIEEIEFCTGILLTQNDNLPSSICLNCEVKLTVACKFKKTCISSEDSFRRLLEDLTMTKVKCEESKSEEPCLKVEHISDDENDDGDYFKSEETYLKVEYNCDDENDDGDYFKSKEPCLKVEYNCDDENDDGDYFKSEEPCPKLEYNYGDENDDGDSFVEGPKDTEVVIEVPSLILKMSSDGGKRKKREEDEEKLVETVSSDNYKDQGVLSDEIERRRKLQNKIRCQRYRAKRKRDIIINSRISEHQTITDEEEIKIQRRKEQDKQKSKRYRDRKRAAKLFNLPTDRPSKTIAWHVPERGDYHTLQIPGPSTRNVPYIPPTHTPNAAGPSMRNALYIPISYSDYNADIQTDIPSQVNYVPQLDEPIMVNYASNPQNILSRGVQNNIQDVCSQPILNSRFSQHQTLTVEEETILKRRKEQDKQKSKRYRDKKRAAKLINLQTDQPSKTIAKHVSERQNVHTSQIPGPSTRNIPHIPPTHTPNAAGPSI